MGVWRSGDRVSGRLRRDCMGGSRPRQARSLATMGWLVVDPWHWLEPDGSLPTSRLRRQALRVARLIEYGADLEPGEFRPTLVECRRRPGGRPCSGFVVVGKLPDGEIESGCPVCGGVDTLIHNWEDTFWGLGFPPPLRAPDLEKSSGP